MKDNCLTLSRRWREGMQAGCILAHAGHSCTKHDLQLCQQTDTETKKAFNLSTHVSPPQTTRQGSGTVSKPEAVRPSAQPHMTAPRTTDTLRIPRTGAGPSPSPEKPALPSPGPLSHRLHRPDATAQPSARSPGSQIRTREGVWAAR